MPSAALGHLASQGIDNACRLGEEVRRGLHDESSWMLLPCEGNLLVDRQGLGRRLDPEGFWWFVKGAMRDARAPTKP
jgi:hypothetical protein